MQRAAEPAEHPEHTALYHAAMSAASELESLLRARGAVGSGLGALTRSLGEDELPLTLSARLRALASIRNRAAHQPGALTAEHLRRFISEAQDVREHLAALQAGALRFPDVQGAVWLTRELRARETQASFSPPPRPVRAVRDLSELDRPVRRHAAHRMAALALLVVLGAAVLVWALLSL